MIDRRRVWFPLLAAAAVVLTSSCAPNESAQTVSFVLELDAERLSSIEFVVNYSSGDFAGSTGQCKVSAAAGGPSASLVAEAPVRTIHVSAPRKVAETSAERGIGSTSSTSSTTHTTNTTNTTNTTTTTDATDTTTTTEDATTTTTTTTVTVTTTLPGPPSCGNGHRDNGEQCDDGNVASGDGCNGNCKAEFAFDSVVSGDPSHLTVHVVNGLGIAPGTTLAFCKFQGDVKSANFVITTTDCDLYGGGVCNKATDADVTESTTTTTSTTTTSSTTTTTRLITTTTITLQ